MAYKKDIKLNSKTVTRALVTAGLRPSKNLRSKTNIKSVDTESVVRKMFKYLNPVFEDKLFAWNDKVDAVFSKLEKKVNAHGPEAWSAEREIDYISYCCLDYYRIIIKWVGYLSGETDIHPAAIQCGDGESRNLGEWMVCTIKPTMLDSLKHLIENLPSLNRANGSYPVESFYKMFSYIFLLTLALSSCEKERESEEGMAIGVAGLRLFELLLLVCPRRKTDGGFVYDRVSQDGSYILESGAIRDAFVKFYKAFCNLAWAMVDVIKKRESGKIEIILPESDFVQTKDGHPKAGPEARVGRVDEVVAGEPRSTKLVAALNRLQMVVADACANSKEGEFLFVRKDYVDVVNELWRNQASADYAVRQCESAEIAAQWMTIRQQLIAYAKSMVNGPRKLVKDLSDKSCWLLFPRFTKVNEEPHVLDIGTLKELLATLKIAEVPRKTVKMPRPRIKKDGEGTDNDRPKVDIEKLPCRLGRFAYSRDFKTIVDVDHERPDYEIDPYLKLKKSAAEVIKQLVVESKKKKSGGWCKSKENWRGLFQDPPYSHFKDEQIDIGKQDDGLWYWRIIPDEEFDKIYRQRHSKSIQF